MRPFFSYFGSKWRGARRYGPPRRDLVIEPFAGSAAYSVYWNAPRVRLYDLSEDVVAAWDWLINCSESDVRAIADEFRSTEEWLALPDGPRQVVDWNINYAQGRSAKSLAKWYLRYTQSRELTGAISGVSVTSSGEIRERVWNARLKERIIVQKPLIAEWTVERRDYRDIPIDEAHYFVDPPYQGAPGRRYLHNEIDYPDLAEWVRSLPGSVDVCENDGADWLSFSPLYALRSADAERESCEVVWRNEPVDLLDLARDKGA